MTPRVYTSERPSSPARVGGDLFRAHVAQGAEQLTGLGSARGRQKVGGGDVGDAEVEHLGLAGFIDQDVAGLEVAMNDALVVGVLHRVAHPGQQLEARRPRRDRDCGRTRPGASRG